MANDSFKNNWQILSFNLLIVLVFIFFYGHFGDVIVDSFREAYIPEQILAGKSLYKNIFTIYAPFAYLFNSLLFLLLGTSLKVLYFAGLLATLGICNLVFQISNIFMNKTYSLSIVLFVIAGAVLSPNVFNYIFPYSYGILYGLFFILASIYFAFKNKLPLAYLMYSLAVCSKYEFVFLLPLLIFVSDKKDWWKYLISFLIPIFITFLPLFLLGTTIESLITSLQITMSMASTKTLYWFYSVMGLIFRWEIIPIYLVNFLKVFIPLIFLYYFRTWWLITGLFIYFYFAVSPEILIYAGPLTLILLIINYTKLTPNKKFFIFASLLLSIKVFFAQTLESYGVFFIPFALIPLFLLIARRYKKSLATITLICALTLGLKNGISLFNKDSIIKTDRGVFYTNTNYGNSINLLINYIEKNTKIDDKILIYPECLSVNFLSDRDSDNKFYSLIPLYIETFGEQLVLKRFEITKPEYIILSNYNTSNYYYSFFGLDYADEIFDYIVENYELKAKIGEDAKNLSNKLIFSIYKIKK